MTATAPGSRARPAKPRPPVGLWFGLLAAALITVWAGTAIGFDLSPLFSGSSRGWIIVEQFFTPNWAFLGRTTRAWIETLSIAVLATLFGCLVALIASMLASRVTARSAWVHRSTRFVLSLVRSLPDVGYGLLLVALVGVGSLAGTLALVMFNIGIAAKLTSETIDAIDRGPLEAADAAGANVVQRARVAVVPQILPNYLSYVLYVFELNIRASVVIGVVGGGGIGSTISVEFARFNYDNLAAVIVVLFLVVFAIDQFSRYIRSRLI